MSSEDLREPDLLGACIVFFDPAIGVVDAFPCVSVLAGFESGVNRLAGRGHETAVLLVGEAEDGSSLQDLLKSRGHALARSIGRPGLFLTLAAQDLVRDRIQLDATFEDLGVFGAEDTGRADRIFAVVHPDLPEVQLPQKTIRGNCPRLHRSFVGRHRDIDELQNLILQRGLVTIVGPPGVGKTATAIHVLRTFGDEYSDGSWWFSVEDRSSLDELLQAIASEPGLLDLKGPLSVERVAGELAAKRAIVVLDGCDGMAGDVANLCSEVAARAKGLTLLLTSTRAIGAEEEHVHRLRPLSLPRSESTGDHALIESEALSLLVDRAGRAGVWFPLDDQNLEYATQICELVDGLPVAIELVAASLRTSSLARIAEELAAEKGPLSSSALADPDRAKSLEKALEISYRTIPGDLRRLLCQSALFRGEWKLPVAEDLWREEIGAADLSAMHRQLVEASWLAFDPDQETYRMLHTIRAFSWAQAGEDRDGIRMAFCDGMAGLSESVLASLQGSGKPDAEALLSRHYADFAYALEMCLKDRDRCVVGSRLMKSMVQFWLQRNLMDDAERLSEIQLRVASGLDAARALVMLGVVNLRRRRLEQAECLFRRCFDLAQAEGSAMAQSVALVNLGLVMGDKGKYAEALQFFGQGIAMLRGVANPSFLCAALCNAADAEVKRTSATIDQRKRKGFIASARAYLEEAGSLYGDLDPMREQALWHTRGAVAMAQRNHDEAEGYYMRAIAACNRHGLRHEAGEATEALAEINLARDMGPTAAKLLGLSRELRRESGKHRTDAEIQRFGWLMTELHNKVDSDRAEKLMKYGEKLDLADILTSVVYNG